MGPMGGGRTKIIQKWGRAGRAGQGRPGRLGAAGGGQGGQGHPDSRGHLAVGVLFPLPLPLLTAAQSAEPEIADLQLFFLFCCVVCGCERGKLRAGASLESFVQTTPLNVRAQASAAS